MDNLCLNGGSTAVHAEGWTSEAGASTRRRRGGPAGWRPDAARAFVAGRPTDADLIDNQLVAAYVELMDESEILELLSSSASDAIPSQASWRLPPPRVVHDFGACLCGCSDELWAVEAEDPSRPREI